MPTEILKKLVAYRAWADEMTFRTVRALPSGEAERLRATRWESIVYTLSHVLVVDDIFKHHLEGHRHGYTYRNTDQRLTVGDLWDRQQAINRWYADYARGLEPDAADEVVHFEFVGGGKGNMTRAEILLHVVNHGTYHRGLISDMLCQVPADMPANDLPVFLRERG